MPSIYTICPTYLLSIYPMNLYKYLDLYINPYIYKLVHILTHLYIYFTDLYIPTSSHIPKDLYIYIHMFTYPTHVYTPFRKSEISCSCGILSLL